MSNQAAALIERDRIISIVRGVAAERLPDVAEALWAGGIRLMELPFDAARPETHRETAAAIRALRDRFDGRMAIGAGTVITEELAELAADAGALYAAMPGCIPAVLSKIRALGMAAIPGAMTPAEILSAWNDGADFVKLFPAGELGPAYLKAIKVPLKQVPILAFSSITPSNIGAFLKAGACGAGVGSCLVKPAWAAAGEYEKITAAAEELLRAANEP